jgi:hypothetical protein
VLPDHDLRRHPRAARGGAPREWAAVCASARRFLFLGDYVDRGHHSLSTFLYLACLKIKAPDRIHLLRGNHESRQVSQTYGPYTECLLNSGHAQVWAFANEVFDLLPFAAVVSGRFFAVHGGLSPSLPYVCMISELDRRGEIPDEGPITDAAAERPARAAPGSPSARGPRTHSYSRTASTTSSARTSSRWRWAAAASGAGSC